MPDAGLLFAVVGPSGVGKDSLIGFARAHLAGDSSIMFVRRFITRPSDPGAEDHVTVTDGDFLRMQADGAFAVTWAAHGLRYGVPMQALVHVKAGGTAVLNGSRAALAAVHARFARVQAVEIVARPEVIAARLGARGREDAAAVAQRLARRVADYPGAQTAIVIDNSGALETAGRCLTDILTGAGRFSRRPAPGAARHDRRYGSSE